MIRLERPCSHASVARVGRRARRGVATALAGALAAGVALGSTTARAGNLDTFYLGNEAAMQAGASTASAARGSAVWYNPAGLARIDRGGIDGSITAFTLELGEDVDLDTNIEGAETSRLTTLAFAIVPASLAYTRKLSFGGLGVGLFVPHQRAVFLRTRLRAPGLVEDEPQDLSIDVHAREQEYYGGPALGIPLGPDVDVGLGLFVNYRNVLQITALNLSVGDADGNRAVSLSHDTLDEQTFGLRPVAGVSVRPAEGWHAGLVLRLPTLRVYRQVQTVGMRVEEGPADGMPELTFVDDFDEEIGFSFGALTPLRLHLGLARDLGDGQISLDASYRAAFDDPDVGIDQKGVVNARLGGVLSLDDTTMIGGGLFSDRGVERLDAESSEGREVDYYGVTLGASFDTVYGVKSRGAETYTDPVPLIFRTTVALSYSLGLGRLQRAELSRQADDSLSLAVRVKDVVEHQVVVHVGSTLFD